MLKNSKTKLNKVKKSITKEQNIMIHKLSTEIMNTEKMI